MTQKEHYIYLYFKFFVVECQVSIAFMPRPIDVTLAQILMPFLSHVNFFSRIFYLQRRVLGMRLMGWVNTRPMVCGTPYGMASGG